MKTENVETKVVFDPEEWLNITVSAKGTPKLYDYLSFLVVCNGGFRVTCWGTTSFGNGHQQGLEQVEALDLMQYAAFIDGLEAGGVPIHQHFKPYFDAYCAKNLKKIEEQEKVESIPPALEGTYIPAGGTDGDFREL